ncbi:MAG: DNA polymerase III subunit delta' C-terminal domain-containing protein [Dehalococcoidales bacterium]|jgi:DNA polymerase-3 subunit delta'|nr:DNA polymerase III subunit delta' C-terminal domain-containing protein [Dehalococcoidales bacterium]MDP7525256.1 DNA polymerase III subunit delta' C-terminal domain-containing protein [Dehalococcoidales bacterium]
MWTVIRQARAVSLLQRSLETDSLAHAYLFIGPAHVGKMALALNLSQGLNCEAPDAPCGECLSCQKIISAKHADVRIIDLSQDEDSAETENRAKIRVEQIEELQHSASLPPFEGKYKVFIIDGAEFLSIGAANRLLKTLEEPLDNVVFILLTTDEQLLPATVVSRCQRVELSATPADEIEVVLSSRWSIEPEKARLLARLSHGCLGWAVSAALDDNLVKQRGEGLDKWLDIINGDAEERFTYAAQLATQFGRNRGLVHQRLDLWLEWWRDLLLVKVGSGDSITNIDRLDLLTDMSGGFSLARIRAFIQSIRTAAKQLRQNANARLVLEVLMLDIPETEESVAV